MSSAQHHSKGGGHMGPSVEIGIFLHGGLSFFLFFLIVLCAPYCGNLGRELKEEEEEEEEDYDDEDNEYFSN